MFLVGHAENTFHLLQDVRFVGAPAFGAIVTACYRGQETVYARRLIGCSLYLSR